MRERSEAERGLLNCGRKARIGLVINVNQDEAEASSIGWKIKKHMNRRIMSIRMSGVYLVPAATADMNEKSISNASTDNNQQQPHHHHHHHHHSNKTVTIVAAAPQRSNSVDYLNFEEKRQIIASSLSLSDFLTHGPAAAAAAAKEVAANTVIGKSKCQGQNKRN